MDGEEQEPSDNSDCENLRELILQKLVSLESSDVSDEDSYQVRLSCILEDDESEGSAAGISFAQLKENIPKNEETTQKSCERDKKDEDEEEEVHQKTEDEAVIKKVESAVSENVTEIIPNDESNKDSTKIVQVTDLDEVSVKNLEDSNVSNISNNEKTENETTDDKNIAQEDSKTFSIGIQKLKSSDNVLKRPFISKQTEFSSDSSDLDISISNSNEQDGTVSQVQITEIQVEDEEDKDDTLSSTPDYVCTECEKSLEQCEEAERNEFEESSRLEDKDDGKSLSSVFETISFGRSSKKDGVSPGGSCISLQDVHIRGVLPKQYDPPVPPETYLWEELRRSKEKGGYPWTHLDQHPDGDDIPCKNETDHEYEPINPPPQSIAKDEEGTAMDYKSSIPETDKHFVRIPLDDEVIAGDEDEDKDIAMAEELKTPEDMEVERIAAAQELQDQLEHRYLAATPTTTASRTDCDVNTSMLDSSGLEDLPLNRGSRNKKAMQTKSEQMRAQAQGIHQKIRNQAGKLRNKLRNIPKPSFKKEEKASAKERQKTTSATQEKTKFKLPERPKFSFPERPKINLPERPKFKFPERPKFNLPERPKISLPSFGRTKTPRERQPSNSSSKKFDFDFKTSKIFSKKSKQRGDYMTSSPKQTRGLTPPPVTRSKGETLPEKRPVGSRWTGRFDDIQYADADDVDDGQEEMRETESRRSEKSESLSDFRDKDLGYTEDLEIARLPPGRTISTKSSMSHLSDREIISSGSSEDRLRKGVLEEIDSDEFFLRQKGISQEDIDMGKYLTDEIREAFRSPVVNALAQMDYDYDEMDVENIDPRPQITEKPPRPSRNRSLRKKMIESNKSSSDPAINQNDYYRTYPPSRPSRKSRSQSKTREDEEDSKPRYENEVQMTNRYENVEDNVSEYYKSPGSVKSYHHYQVPRSNAPTVQPQPMKRKYSSKDKLSNKKKNEGWVEVEIETSVEEIKDAPPPQPLIRRKSRKGSNDQQRSIEEVVRNAEAQVVQEEKSKEPDYIIPAAPEEIKEAPPIPPLRTRSLSRGSRSLHSLAMEDDRIKKSQSRDVYPKKEVVQLEKIEVQQTEEIKETPKTHHYEKTGDDDVSVGYATVEKSTLERPERLKKSKPQRPPPPRKKRELSSPSNTLPKRMPVRPVRNYSTLGPSRPARKKRTTSVEHIYADDRQSQAYVEISDDNALRPLTSDEIHGSSKDLQKEEVIEKMKGRPLPPPPRPPRQKSKGPDDSIRDGDQEESEAGAASTSEAFETRAFVHAAPPGTEIVEEVCVSTQTDPLPDDLCLEMDDDSEIMQEFSHEQLRIQEEFLEEMKKEEERLQREMENRRIQADLDKAEKNNQVIHKLEEIVAEERRIFEERQKEVDERKQLEERTRKEQELAEEARRIEEERKILQEERRNLQEAKRAQEEEQRKLEEKKKAQLEVSDVDMGYASLDRRELRTEPEIPLTSSSTGAIPKTRPVTETQQSHPIYVPVIPDPTTSVEVLKTDRLAVKELEVDRLNVNELQANRIQLNSLQSNQLTVEDINSRAGNLVLGNIQLPPDFIQQIVTMIPWDEIRTSQERQGSIPQAPTPSSTPVESSLPNFPVNLSIPQLRPSGFQESEDENLFAVVPPRRSHRRHHSSRQHSKYSSDEEDEEDRRELTHKRHLTRAGSQNITELSRQLARACTSAGIRAMRNFSNRIRANVEAIQAGEDKAFYVQAILCIAVVLIAGLLILSFDSKTIYHYHWDFQFPPRPPPDLED